MSIPSSLSAASSTFVNTTPIPAPGNQLNMSTFITMLTTELANQDPTAPMDDSALAGQISQLGTVQGISTLTQQGQISEAAALIGKVVTGTSDASSTQAGGNMVTGIVSGMSVQNGVSYLEVTDANGNLSQMPLANIQSVSG